MCRKIALLRNWMTNFINVTPITKYTVTGFILCSIYACKKEGPATRDGITPKATLTINGGGFSKTFYSDSDYTYGQLNLIPDTIYDFRIVGTDAGAIHTLQSKLPKTFFTHSNLNGVPNFSDTTIIESNGDLYTMYTNSATEADPYTSFIFSGSFVATRTGADRNVTIKTFAVDFENRTARIQIACLVSMQPPVDYGWVKL